ncbi:hypothetical protein [Nostoc sp. CMAA1605]|uniref:hypothetical protein n=1 Tax=Nostoc sp. CMAA1605 TaxID=2055159 RepID=UPI001F3650C8|nr:hypothetical protein [Nostoc sp. CMAA1605]
MTTHLQKLFIGQKSGSQSRGQGAGGRGIQLYRRSHSTFPKAIADSMMTRLAIAWFSR